MKKVYIEFFDFETCVLVKDGFLTFESNFYVWDFEDLVKMTKQSFNVDDLKSYIDRAFDSDVIKVNKDGVIVFDFS